MLWCQPELDRHWDNLYSAENIRTEKREQRAVKSQMAQSGLQDPECYKSIRN